MTSSISDVLRIITMTGLGFGVVSVRALFSFNRNSCHLLKPGAGYHEIQMKLLETEAADSTGIRWYMSGSNGIMNRN